MARRPIMNGIRNDADTCDIPEPVYLQAHLLVEPFLMYAWEHLNQYQETGLENFISDVNDIIDEIRFGTDTTITTGICCFTIPGNKRNKAIDVNVSRRRREIDVDYNSGTGIVVSSKAVNVVQKFVPESVLASHIEKIEKNHFLGLHDIIDIGMPIPNLRVKEIINNNDVISYRLVTETEDWEMVEKRLLAKAEDLKKP